MDKNSTLLVFAKCNWQNVGCPIKCGTQKCPNYYQTIKMSIFCKQWFFWPLCFNFYQTIQMSKFSKNLPLCRIFWPYVVLPFVVLPFVALLTLCRLTLCCLTLCRWIQPLPPFSAWASWNPLPFASVHTVMCTF